MTLDPILKTKLFIPPLREGIVSRPRLIERINQNINNKALLISAPAGFGKSTLLAEWSSQAQTPVCWVSLDKTENDPINFLSYLIASVQNEYNNLGDTVLNALRTPGTPPVTGLLNAWVNEVAEYAKDFVLVLDDFHHIQDQAVAELVCHLTENQPPQLHLLLASRAELPFSCSRLRAQGDLVDLGISELRFTSDETTEYLNRQLGKRISESDSQLLSKRTEGWIAGLHMAVLSMRSSNDIHQYVAQFSAQNQFITDYLLDEILLQQSDEIKKFLLVTSVLNKFTAPLCDYLLSTENSQKNIDNLVRSGLFTIPLDTSRTWYRYHHLFSQLLRIRLENSADFSTKDVHGKASDWFANQDMLEESIEHAFLTKDYDLVIQRIEDALDSIIAEGKFRNYLAWLDQIPKKILREKPKLDIVKIFVLHEMGRKDERIQHQKYTDGYLGTLPEAWQELSKEEIANHGILAAVKTLIYASSDFSIEKARESHALADNLLSQENDLWRTLSAGAMPFIDRALGNYESAIQGFNDVLAQVLNKGFFFQAFIIYSALTKSYLERNQLKQAMLTCRKAIELDLKNGGNFPFAKLIYLLMGELMYHSGKLKSAEDYIEKGLDHVIRHGDVYSIIDGYAVLILIQIAKGDQEQAFALINEMKQTLNAYPLSSNTLKLIAAWETYVKVFFDQEKDASMLINEAEFETSNDQYLFDLENHAYVGVYRVSQNSIKVHADFLNITTIRLHLAHNKYQEGLKVVEDTLSGMLTGGCTKHLIEAQILKALLLERLNKKADATETLYAAIQIAATEGYSQVFINEGSDLDALLQNVKKDASLNIEEQIFILQLLEYIHLSTHHRSKKQDIGTEALTPREIEVLKCLESGASYAMAAENLSISRNTLKTHTKRIYQKLGVNGLLKALNKAKTLKII